MHRPPNGRASAPSSSASILIFIAAGDDIPFAHILRRTVVTVAVFVAHRQPFAIPTGALGNAVVGQQQGALSGLGQANDDDGRNCL